MFQRARFGVDKFILVQRYKIHYIEAGAGEPVILLPGSYNTYRTWNLLIPLLAEKYRLLALDYIGAEDSDEPGAEAGYRVREQTDLLARMVRQLGLDRASLVAGSHGSALVFDLALRYPQLTDKIISLEGELKQLDNVNDKPHEYCLKVPVIGDILVQFTRTGSICPGPDSGMAGKSWYSVITPEDEPETPDQPPSIPRNTSRAHWFKINLARKTSRSTGQKALPLKSPLLYLYGTEPKFGEVSLDRTIKYLKTHLPQAWVVGLEGSLNNLAVQKPGDIAGIILEFLRKKPFANA